MQPRIVRLVCTCTAVAGTALKITSSAAATGSGSAICARDDNLQENRASPGTLGPAAGCPAAWRLCWCSLTSPGTLVQPCIHQHAVRSCSERSKAEVARAGFCCCLIPSQSMEQCLSSCISLWQCAQVLWPFIRHLRPPVLPKLHGLERKQALYKQVKNKRLRAFAAPAQRALTSWDHSYIFSRLKAAYSACDVPELLRPSPSVLTIEIGVPTRCHSI